MRKFLISSVLCLSLFSALADDHYVDPSDPSADTSIATELYTIQNQLLYIMGTQIPALQESIESLQTNCNNVVVNIPPVDLTPIINRLDIVNNNLASLLQQVLVLQDINSNIVLGNATLSDIYTLLNRANLQGLSDNFAAFMQMYQAFYYQFSSIFSGMGMGGESLLSVLNSVKESILVVDSSVKVLHNDLSALMTSLVSRLDSILTTLGNHGEIFVDIQSLLQTIADRPVIDLSTLEYNTSAMLMYFTAVQQKYYSDYKAFSYLPSSLLGLHWSSPSGFEEDTTSAAFGLEAHTGNYFNDVIISMENIRRLQAQIIKGGVLNVVYSRAISNEVAIQTIEVTNRLNSVQVSLNEILGSLTNNVDRAEKALEDSEDLVSEGISSASEEVFTDDNTLAVDNASSLIHSADAFWDSLPQCNELPEMVGFPGAELNSREDGAYLTYEWVDITDYRWCFNAFRVISTVITWACVLGFVVAVWFGVVKLWAFLSKVAYGVES